MKDEEQLYMFGEQTTEIEYFSKDPNQEPPFKRPEKMDNFDFERKITPASGQCFFFPANVLRICDNLLSAMFNKKTYVRGY